MFIMLSIFVYIHETPMVSKNGVSDWNAIPLLTTIRVTHNTTDYAAWSNGN